ncbi:MAG: response regulator [Deltaproteobacteria bacterium HGW-Deltaproteobacteria-15]|jgi:DNA-binding response OmpR family regulator|nr:MAG: response regulator [Deltaproteobacteria bacterium HGW-Deltaproteobacteria-15]
MHTFSVLVVDDEKDFLETVVKRLEQRKINVTGVGSGEDALEQLKKKEFSVIILDVKMPGGMDGIEALRIIKKMQPYAEVILLTGHASVETSIEGLKLGAFDYVLKPVKLEDLLARVSAALKRKGGDQKLQE